MRRILFCLTMLASLSALCQTHYEGALSVGGKAGATFSRVNFNPAVEQKMLPGMTAGIMARYIEEKHFGLIAELNMAQCGWKENFDDADLSFSHRFTCIQLPLMTHIFFGNDRVKGFFNAGPQIGVMIADGVTSNFDYRQAAGMEYFIQNTRRTEQYSLDIKNKFDYGICAGAGMELNIGSRQSLLLEGRFYYGLNDAFSNHKTDVFSGSNTMSVLVTLGYLYRLK